MIMARPVEKIMAADMPPITRDNKRMEIVGDVAVRNEESVTPYPVNKNLSASVNVRDFSKRKQKHGTRQQIDGGDPSPV